MRQYVYAALEVDPRYADFVRDLAKYPDTSIVAMRAALVNLATIKKDLVDADIADLKVARVAAGSTKSPPSSAVGASTGWAGQGGERQSGGACVH